MTYTDPNVLIVTYEEMLARFRPQFGNQKHIELGQVVTTITDLRDALKWARRMPNPKPHVIASYEEKIVELIHRAIYLMEPETVAT